MSQYALDNFGAYQKANELFDLVVNDMAELRKNPLCYRLVAQQVARADSVSANIEEGYGRLSRTEYIRFLDFARGSARETRGRYLRLKHWLPEATIQQRVALTDQIIGILTRAIQTLRREPEGPIGKTSFLREEPSIYSDASFPPPPDTRHPPLDTRHPPHA